MKTTKDEVLLMIHNSIIPKIIDIMYDLGYENTFISQEGINDLKLTVDNSLFYKENNQWTPRLLRNGEKYIFDINEIHILKKILIGFTKKLLELRNEQNELKNALKEARMLGTERDIFKKTILVEIDGFN